MSPSREEAPRMLRIGIDEAGLGPTLGPLVVAGAAFRAPGTAGGPGAPPAAPFDADLRRLLDPVVAAPGRPARGRIVVGDSKQIYGPEHDLAALELPVLAFAAAAAPDGRVPGTLDELLASVAADPAERMLHPWYAGPPARLPFRASPADVAAAAAALRAALDGAGSAFLGFAADVVPEARLNAAFGRIPNKADVLFDRSADVLDRLLARRSPGEAAAAALDRLGGRRFYLAPMAGRWPDRFAWAVEETPASSRYRVRLADAEAELRWVVGGDAAHLEIGLASMLAKYLREAFMDLWNGYFEGVCPGVPRTAGYAVDARRWLDATRAARAAAGVPDERLVRTR